MILLHVFTRAHLPSMSWYVIIRLLAQSSVQYSTFNVQPSESFLLDDFGNYMFKIPYVCMTSRLSFLPFNLGQKSNCCASVASSRCRIRTLPLHEKLVHGSLWHLILARA